MTRRLDLTQRQAEALMIAARKQRCRVDVRIGNAVATIYPDEADARPPGEQEIDEGEEIRL